MKLCLNGTFNTHQRIRYIMSDVVNYNDVVMSLTPSFREYSGGDGIFYTSAYLRFLVESNLILGG